jgi:hypothetical protein
VINAVLLAKRPLIFVSNGCIIKPRWLRKGCGLIMQLHKPVIPA